MTSTLNEDRLPDWERGDETWPDRAAWISELAKAEAYFLSQLWNACGLQPDHEMLRAPEVGLVMARGRAGGEGAPFNLGEVAAVRCAVRLRGTHHGVEGHSCALGRDRGKAVIGALCDALMQTPDRTVVAEQILTPLFERRRAAERRAAEKAAATKVEFFTMTRGEG